jgi:hypothetical protein
MRRTLGLLALSLVLFATNATARVEASKLILDAGSELATPTVEILDRTQDLMRVEFTLPALDLQEMSIEGELFQTFAIPGGGQIGEDGQASLPTFSRLVAVPEGVAVSLRVINSDEQSFDNYRPLPMQPADAREFVMDRGWYASGAPEIQAQAVVGEPAIMRDLRVVPVNFQPVSYDPASGRLSVATRIEFELDFSGVDNRNAAPVHRDLIPESFDALYRDAVVGYRAGESNVAPGSILYISTGSVNSQIEPLLEWRRRQGYNVVHSTGGSSNTGTVKNIIQNAYNSYDPPLEFVVLVGDASGSYNVGTYTETYSGYGGEGDHEYTLLEGGDWISDVHIGRLSFDSTSQLAGIVSKILNYEQSPPTSDSGWFNRGRLFGDPGSSGITTVWVNDWLDDQLSANGYSDVTVTSGGNFVTAMTGAVNSGCSIFGYRGYYGMSGWSASGINNTNNGGKLPFALIPTCDTGSFKSDGMCRSEGFLRSPNGGGIGSVGTATIGTHTRYNNCYYMGTWDGAINGSDHRLGVAHSVGKLSLYANYVNYEDSKIYIWCTWNSLMGDPATDLRMSFPASFTVDYPGSIDIDMESVPVNVTEGGGPVEGALVCLYKSGQLSATGYTDASGDVLIPVSGLGSGTVHVTVTKHDFFPHMGTLSAGSSADFVGVSDFTMDGDGIANPGDALGLSVALTNYDTSSASSVTGVISSDDPLVSISDASESFGSIGAGGTAWSAGDFNIAVAPNAPDGHNIDLNLAASSGVDTWDSLLRVSVVAPAFDYSSSSWGGSGSTLDPGESGSLTVTIQNNGHQVASGITGTLSTSSNWVSVTDNGGSWSGLGIGNSGSNSGNTFSLSVSPDCFEGHMATFALTLSSNGGALDTVEFNLQVGTASSNDPLGPDAYGYYAFDNTDTGYPWAPTYSWVEINPNLGGSGTDVGLTDGGWQQDDTNVVNLPFTFQYYGETFTQISICSNGWVAMGVTDQHLYRNWTIPSAGNPDGMIAGFFDNLYQTGSSKVYTWYDTENNRFIIEYSQLRNDYSNATEEFEIILMDPSVHVTTTGDGPILMQYKTVNNTDARDGYATAGISTPDGTDGLLYTYAADYPSAAATLQSGRAILFQPVGSLITGTLEGDITNASNGGSPVDGVGVKVVENGQTLISGGDGHYSGSVQEGSYTVQVIHESFETETYYGVNITEDLTTIVDFSLTDILGPYIQNVTALPNTEDTVGPYLVDVNITDFSAITQMHLYYKVNGGGGFEAPLTLIDAGSGLYQAAIPGKPLSTMVSYWLEAEDAAGNTSRNPATPDTYFDFYVVSYVSVVDDDMQSDTGWSVSGDASTGIWTRVDPIGVFDGSTPVQPEDDVSADGTHCFITGNNETGSQGADDVDGGSTILTSPVYDLSDMISASVNYYRWYTNDTGSSPDSDLWVVEVNDGSGWVDLENTNVSAHEWVAMNFDLADLIDLTATVQFRFTATDDANGSVVEAGVDEFILSGFELPDATAAPEGAAPASLTLLQNLPNPFNPKTSIRFGLPSAAGVDLKVYDASGRLVRTLLSGEFMDAGFHAVDWNGRDDRSRQASSGIYFYVVESGGERESGKMVLLK